jgi:hypothetical protein
VRRLTGFSWLRTGFTGRLARARIDSSAIKDGDFLSSLATSSLSRRNLCYVEVYVTWTNAIFKLHGVVVS